MGQDPWATKDEEAESHRNCRNQEIRILSYNLQLIPKSVSGETFPYVPCRYHDERVAAMFREGFFDDFDILCIQECFDGMPWSMKPLFVTYAAKAGFIHVA